MGMGGLRQIKRRDQVELEDRLDKARTGSLCRIDAGEPPALLIRMSSRPCRATTWSTKRRSGLGIADIGRQEGLTPLGRSSGALRAQATTRQPAAAKRCAISRPSPRVPPVTMPPVRQINCRRLCQGGLSPMHAVFNESRHQSSVTEMCIIGSETLFN
jgi:hypothetical protein